MVAVRIFYWCLDVHAKVRSSHLKNGYNYNMALYWHNKSRIQWYVLTKTSFLSNQIPRGSGAKLSSHKEGKRLAHLPSDVKADNACVHVMGTYGTRKLLIGKGFGR